MDPKPAVARAALERVLARAAELQAATGDEADRLDELTESQVLELGKEVGLAPAHIRQALAEERARVELPLGGGANDAGFHLFGRQKVATQRVVRGTASRVLATLDSWMQNEEWLRVMRQRADCIVWEPRSGLIGGLKRAFGARAYALHRASHISATVVSVDDASVVVRLEADFTVLRRAAASQTVASAAVGAAASGALLIMGIMMPVAVVPAVGAVALSYFGSRRAHRAVIQRGLLTLEQVLDRLERGEQRPASLLGLIDAALPPGRR